MTRKNARNVGAIVVVAALAMVALLVAIARGSAPEYHDESAPATLTISQASGTEDTMQFGEGEGKLVCSSESGEGTLSGSSSTEITYTDNPSGCKLAGVESEVNMEGCQYVSHLEAGSKPPKGTLDLKCAEGHEPTIKQDGKTCVVQILPNQTGMPSLTAKNTLAPANDIDNVITVTGLKWTAKNCAFIKDGTYDNGKIEHTDTIKGDKKGGGAETLTVE